MLEADLHFINEEFHSESVSPKQLDTLLADGWRHFGTQFFRYNLGFYGDDIRRVIPLRIRLADFSLSKSQRRVLRKNLDLKTIIRPITITAAVEKLFDVHKIRFDHAIPNSIRDFISHEPADVPCEALEVSVFDNDTLVAASYFDIGENSTSGIYAMFEPQQSRRGLGIFTMLKEIEFALGEKKEFYYQGYCYEGESFYDYKKRFSGTEGYNWIKKWQTLSLM